MANITVSSDIDTLLQSADNQAIRNNIGLGTLATTNATLETEVTPDDTKLPTSGGVVRYVAGRHPITEFTGTNYQTAAKYTRTLNALPSFNVEAVRIGSEVESMANSLLRGNTNLKYVDAGTLPTIGHEAFKDCTSLEEVDIGFSTTLGTRTFNDCTALTRVHLGAIRNISISVFEGCTALESITIPQTVLSFRDYAFRDCTSLRTINCYTTYSVLTSEATGFLSNTPSDLVIHARVDDDSWTAGSGQSIGGNTSVTVVKDL